MGDAPAGMLPALAGRGRDAEAPTRDARVPGQAATAAPTEGRADVEAVTPRPAPAAPAAVASRPVGETAPRSRVTDEPPAHDAAPAAGATAGVVTQDVGSVDLAARLAAAAAAVPGVLRVAAAGPVCVATHGAGRTVAGVRLAPKAVEVHVAVDRLPIPPIADAVRAATAAVLADAADPREVMVCVDDVDDAALRVFGTHGGSAGDGGNEA